jgi:hypothetical protein
MNYQKQLRKAQKEKRNLSQTIGTLIIFNSATLVEGIRRRWLFGKGVDGNIIGQYRNRDYEMFKVGLNQNANGNVDLTLTGALGLGLTIKKNSDKTYEVFSRDNKYQEISKKYGLRQFNLDSQQTDELFDMLYLMAMEQYFDNVWGA